MRLDEDKSHAIVYSDRPDIRIYDLEAAKEVARLEGHDSRVMGVRQLADGRLAS